MARVPILILTRSQLAVDRQIEQRLTAHAPLSIKVEADRPYLSGFQRAFRANLLVPAFHARRWRLQGRSVNVSCLFNFGHDWLED